MIINLFDMDFRHLPISVHGKISDKIEYTRDNFIWSGITVFTGAYIGSDVVHRVDSKIKIAWILEPRAYQPEPYIRVENTIHLFDKVITHDSTLLEKFPEKCIKAPFGGCWISIDNYKIFDKTKTLSMIYSNKTFMEGHKLRHKVAASLGSYIDLFGNGSKKSIQFKEEGLKDYKFSIVIENCRTKNYFTEKLLDCFAVGTVPIYWGAPNIADYFDTEGMFLVESLEDIKKIVYNLDDDAYTERLPSVHKNFNLFKDYSVTEDWLYENIYRDYE